MGFDVPEAAVEAIRLTISEGVQDGLKDFNPYLLIDSLCKPPSVSAIQYLTWTINSGTAAVHSRGDPVRLAENAETLLLFYAFHLSIVDAVPPTSSDNVFEDAMGFVPSLSLGGTPIFGGEQTILTIGSQINLISFGLFARQMQSFLVGANEAGGFSGIIPVLLRTGPSGDLQYGFSKNATLHSYRTQIAVAFTTVPLQR